MNDPEILAKIFLHLTNDELVEVTTDPQFVKILSTNVELAPRLIQTVSLADLERICLNPTAILSNFCEDDEIFALRFNRDYFLPRLGAEEYSDSLEEIKKYPLVLPERTPNRRRIVDYLNQLNTDVYEKIYFLTGAFFNDVDLSFNILNQLTLIEPYFGTVNLDPEGAFTFIKIEDTVPQYSLQHGTSSQSDPQVLISYTQLVKIYSKLYHFGVPPQSLEY